MINSFPDYQNLNIENYPLVSGSYALGIINTHRPDISIILVGEREIYENYTLLDLRIQNALSENKTVCVVIWDEDVSFDINFVECVTKYNNEPVYVITQLDDFSILNYQDLGVKNILEVPWWLLNECLVYYRFCNQNNYIDDFDSNNFLCMVGRPEPHKYFLVDCIEQYLDIGLITTISQYKNFIKTTNPPYSNLSHKHGSTSANTKIGEIWLSANVENFLFIEEKYKNIPLVIHPETSVGLFQTSEKSIWPLLLGKLCLIAGRHHLYKYLQRFYDVDFSKYINLNFDSKHNGFEFSSAKERICQMVSDNADLIKHPQNVYTNLASELESARWTLGKNLYNFVVSQINKIPVKE